jgi:histidine triad (HIT) family protein
MLSQEESEKIRQALLNQIEEMDISEEEKDKAAAKISQMPPEQLESFIKPKCIFCSISQSQIESYKIAENSEAVVVLEINPLSKGHSILIPKNHISIVEFSMKIHELLQDAIKNIKAKLNPKEISISSSETQGHAIINILPLSGNETGKRESASKEQLEELTSLLKFEAKKPEPKPRIEAVKVEKPKPPVSEPEIIIEKAPVRVP